MIDQPERVYQPITVKEWLLTLFLSFIPIVGIVMFFVWAFSAETHPSKKNWAKAGLIWAAIIIVLYIIIFAVFGAALLGGAMGGNEFQ